MAIDTRQKRASATLLLMPFRHAAQTGVNGVSDAERLAVTWMYSGITIAVPSVSLIPLKSLVLDIDDGLGMTLLPVGNTLSIEVVNTVPTATPPGGKGLVCRISAGIFTIYIWDPVATTWLSK